MYVHNINVNKTDSPKLTGEKDFKQKRVSERVVFI